MNKLSYAIGTTVKVARASDFGNVSLSTVGVVTCATLNQGSLQYAVGGTAWFDHSQLDWVADPTEESLAEAAKIENEDFEDDEDEEF